MRKILIVALLVGLALLGCTISTTGPVVIVVTATPEEPLSVDEVLVATFRAQTQMAEYLHQTLQAMTVLAPSSTPRPTASETLQTARLTLTVETNCRTGPGPAYPVVGAVHVGEVAEVIGRSELGDNWIVRLPSNPVVFCWVWGQYATVSANAEDLPVYQPPPTPTPSGPSSGIALPVSRTA